MSSRPRDSAFLAHSRAMRSLVRQARRYAAVDATVLITGETGTGKELAAQIAPYVQAHIVEYTIAHDEAAFVKAVKDAIRERRIIARIRASSSRILNGFVM